MPAPFLRLRLKFHPMVTVAPGERAPSDAMNLPKLHVGLWRAGWIGDTPIKLGLLQARFIVKLMLACTTPVCLELAATQCWTTSGHQY